MDFCPECGSMLLPKDDGNGGKKLECSCGYKKDLTTGYEVSRKIEAEETVKMIEDDGNTGLGINEICPECGNDKATYILLQTRSADEAPTRIFTCTKCKHKWRAYD